MFGAGSGRAGADQTSLAEKDFQQERFQAIVELLLAAGYFRARIVALSAFDKVVGGLCWCITSSGEAIDVDILFQENSSIGARIALSESIVEALRQMGCPHALQAHQIQGGINEADFPALFPVVVWLVKRFYETRERTAAQLRRFAQLQFEQRRFDAVLPAQTTAARPDAFLAAARAAQVQRILKRLGAVDRATEEARVHSVLLEYGETPQSRYGLAGAAPASDQDGRGATATLPGAEQDPGDGPEAGNDVLVALAKLGSADTGAERLSGFERKMAAAAKAASMEETRRMEAEAEEAERLLSGMTRTAGAGVAVAGGQVVTMLTTGTDLRVAATAYEKRRAQNLEEMAHAAGGTLGSAFKRQKAVLKQRLKKENVRRELGETEAQLLKSRLEEAQTQLDKQTKYNRKVRGEIEQLAELERSGDPSRVEDLAELKRLVTENEALKQREGAFRGACKIQRDELLREREQLRVAGADPQEARLAEIEATHARALSKYQRLRELLAEKNQTLADASRRVDDIPTRTELIQYERRFVELYAQVTRKLEELKKFYAMHNVLEQKRSFLEKEVTLLQSVTDSFDASMAGRQKEKDHFLAEFDKIIAGVAHQERRQGEALRGRGVLVVSLRAEHQELVDRERKYFAAVKAFQDECERNETFERKLQEVGG